MNQDFKAYLIEGKMYNRIPAAKSCQHCGATKGELHMLGCLKEDAVCKKHTKVIECNCPIREGESV